MNVVSAAFTTYMYVEKAAEMTFVQKKFVRKMLMKLTAEEDNMSTLKTINENFFITLSYSSNACFIVFGRRLFESESVSEKCHAEM